MQRLPSHHDTRRPDPVQPCRAAAGGWRKVKRSQALFNGTPVWVNITNNARQGSDGYCLEKGEKPRKVRSSNHFTFILSKILIG